MEAADSRLSGSCNCGAVQFEITEPPLGAAWCHCGRCQKRTGTSASASVVIAPGSLNILSGEDVVRGWTPPGDDKAGEKCFCAVCGSHLWAKLVGDPPPIVVRFSAFDSDPGVRPMARQFVAYAAHWDAVPEDGLPRFDERITAPETEEVE